MNQTTHKPRRTFWGSSILPRFRGFAALLAGVLFATWGYVHRDYAPWYFDATARVLSFFVPALFLVGFLALFNLCNAQVGRIGKLGLVLGLAGSAMGSAYAVPWSAFATRADPLSLLAWLDTVLVWWLHIMLAGLPLAGIAALGARPLRSLGILLLAMGAFGWAYLVTASDVIFEARLEHVVFGLLFSLSWVVLGLTLLRRGSHSRARSGALG
jgi:hypothetical protein